jgi:CRP/FNR family cyclic AMP-dependent transcriptional regulator
MPQQHLLDTFAGHTFVSALSERHRMVLASGAKPFTATPGQLLAKEGEEANKFFLIQSGRVSIGIKKSGGDVVPVHTVGPGEVVGWSWLVPPHRWKFECRAVQDVKAISFDGEWLREKCENDHELGYHLTKELLAVVSGRLTATRQELLGIHK